MADTTGIYVGLMSGTSLDGISSAVVRFHGTGPITHELLGVLVREYTPEQRERLQRAIQGASPQEYCRLHVDLGEWLSATAIDALADAGVARTEVCAIASHGQTIWHEPGYSTWQLGAAAVIAERIGVDVVSDFRARDVAAGGQGAPLVPIADALLYAHAQQWRLLQNIGGMANVTLVPPHAEAHVDLRTVRAFDTGPGVAVIDAVVRSLYADYTYDVDGAIAATGTPHRAVLDTLLRDPYFALEPPKSTGREYFGVAYADALVARCRAAGCSDADIVATATALTARSIANAYKQFIAEPYAEVVISGGGAKNRTLVEMLRAELAPTPLEYFDVLYYNGEAKEAVAFALLAHLHRHHLPGNVIGATGARGPRVLGALTPGARGGPLLASHQLT